MRRVAEAIHPAARIRQYPSVEAAVADGLGGGLLYDRCVSSYAFETAAAAAAFINRFDAAYVNLLSSRGATFQTSVLSRHVTYFSLDELQRHLSHPLIHLFGHRAPPRVAYRNEGRPVIEGFFLHAAPAVVSAFLDRCDAIGSLRDFVREKSMMAWPALDLLASAE